MSQSPYYHVIGLDPSLTSTGLAHVDLITNPFGTPLVTTHRVRSKGRKDDDWEDRWDRINALREDVLAHVPDGSLVVIEAPAYASTTGSMFDRTCYWRDLARDLRDRKACVVCPVAPQVRMRYATGYGGGANAGKDNVLASVIKRYPTLNVTGNDIADGVIFAMIGMRLIRQPLDALPGANLKDIAKLQAQFDSLIFPVPRSGR